MVTVTYNLSNVKLGLKGTIDEFGKKQNRNRNIRTCCGLNEYENDYHPRSN
jgi:hypothetical protein